MASGWTASAVTGLRLRRPHLMRHGCQRRYRPAFQSGDGFTQGKKRLPRHGGLSHDVSSRSIVPVMFLWIPELRKKSQQHFMRIYSFCPEFHSRKTERKALYDQLRKEASMARIDQSDDWRDRHAPTISTFESLAHGGLQPPAGRISLAHRQSHHRDRRFSRRRRFRGHGAGNAVRPARPVRRPRHIASVSPWKPAKCRTGSLLYRRPIIDYWAENEETLGDIITHVLIHEIGHHFGLSRRRHGAHRGKREQEATESLTFSRSCYAYCSESFMSGS